MKWVRCILKQSFFFLPAIQCGELGPPVHGTMIGSGTAYGSVIRFVCNNGYRVIGSAERTCQADGTWNGQDAICEG